MLSKSCRCKGSLARRPGSTERKASASPGLYRRLERGAMQKLGGRDRWAAEAEWAWSFDGGIPAIVFELSPGRFFTRGRIIPGAEENTFILRAHHAESDTVDTYSGFTDKNKQLEFTNQVIQISRPARLLIKTLADHKRLVITLQYGSNERRLQQGATLGYTRKGTVFATRSRPLHECVVTGGEGISRFPTMVKCIGSVVRDASVCSKQTPEKVIAAYEARKQRNKKKNSLSEQKSCIIVFFYTVSLT